VSVLNGDRERVPDRWCCSAERAFAEGNSSEWDMQQWCGRRSRATSCRDVSTEIFRHRCLTCLVGQDGQFVGDALLHW